jgi:hypothetical protein
MAFAKISLFDPDKRIFDLLQLGPSSASGLYRHGLGAHRIHAGQPPNPGLIEFDGFFGLLACFFCLKQHLLQVSQQIAVVLDVMSGPHGCIYYAHIHN